MDGQALRQAAVHLLTQAAFVRAVFPNAEAMRAVLLPPYPGAEDGPADERVRAAFGYLLAEVREVQSGRATTLDVLDDEIAHLCSHLDAPDPDPGDGPSDRPAFRCAWCRGGTAG